MILKFIENLSRLILEWAIRKQDKHERPIIDEVAEGFSFRVARTERAKKALL